MQRCSAYDTTQTNNTCVLTLPQVSTSSRGVGCQTRRNFAASSEKQRDDAVLFPPDPKPFEAKVHSHQKV